MESPNIDGVGGGQVGTHTPAKPLIYYLLAIDQNQQHQQLLVTHSVVCRRIRSLARRETEEEEIAIIIKRLIIAFDLSNYAHISWINWLMMKLHKTVFICNYINGRIHFYGLQKAQQLCCKT